MAISLKKYVDITSGVGAGVGVRQRELIGRVFTINPLVPTNSIVEFTNADDVGSYFGTSSEEYARAALYFGFISKNITRPEKIGFARWTNANAAPRIYGAKGAQALASWTSITAGAFTLTIGGVAGSVTGANFSAAASLSDVASIVQTRIRAVSGVQFASVVVTWDAVRQSFNFVGSFNGDEAISVTASGGVDIAGQLGWLSGAILSDGASIETLTETLSQSSEATNNFGSFVFIPDLTLSDYQEIGEWNQTRNVEFMCMVPVSAANDATWSAGLLEYAGLAITLSPVATEFPEMIPMMILAATDYDRRSSVQNYMFQIANVTASVTTTLQSDRLDGLRINYYGQTQTAGQSLQFYQRGVLTGQATAPTDMNVYANEMWFKDAASAAVMELLLNVGRVPANDQGRSELRTTLQSVIDRALFNGTISVGKPLNNTQKLYIAQVTGSNTAYHQVQGLGYWLDVVIQSYVTEGGNTEYKAVYTLVYSKDDAIRKVEGSHILI